MIQIVVFTVASLVGLAILTYRLVVDDDSGKDTESEVLQVVLEREGQVGAPASTHAGGSPPAPGLLLGRWGEPVAVATILGHPGVCLLGRNGPSKSSNNIYDD